MIKVDLLNPAFAPAYANALRAFERIELERPRQYFQQWEETYKCKVFPIHAEFAQDADYTWFMLRWG
jgi:hypothetical protein